MKKGFVYKNAHLYELVMLLLYGRHYFTRYRVIADVIEPGASVLDLCCGPGILYERYLRAKSVTYTGIDINERFIKRINKLGSCGLLWDLRQDAALPMADYVLIQASLYHFLPEPERVIDRMLSAARKQVIVAEPVRNFANGGTPRLRTFARSLTDPGTGLQHERFTEKMLDQFFANYSSRIHKCFSIPGGREKVYILNVGQ